MTDSHASSPTKVEMIELTSRGAQQNVENPALKTVGVGDGYLGINSDGCADPFISRLTPLFSLGGTRQLDDSDLGSINPVDGVFVNKTKLQGLWDEECETKGEKRERSLFSVLAKLIGFKRYFLAFLCEFLASGNMFVGPAIMKILLGHLTGTDPVSETNLYLMAAVSFLAPCLAAVASAQSDMILQKASYHMQNGLMPLIFGSVMNLSPAERAAKMGTVNVLLASDAQELPTNLNMLVVFIMAPFQVGIAMWLLYRELGVALFMSFACIFAGLPLLILSFMGMSHFINKKKEFADKRVKIFNELIAGIRIIKYYAWEKPFSGKLEAIRQNEVTEMSHIYQSWILMSVYFDAMPLAMPIAVFYTYMKLGNDLTYSNMFASLALFKNMIRPLTALSTLSMSITSAKVAIDRILGVLNADKRVDYVNRNDAGDEKMAGNAVIVDKASFAWEMESVADDSDNAIVAGSSSSKASFSKLPSKEDRDTDADERLLAEARNRALNTLSGVDLTIKKGHLAAVVGPVGCGKTSLVNAMLGEMYLKEGSVTLGGKVAYHSQEPWILNANIRDNITFGKPLDESLLEKVIENAALTADLKTLPAGLNTEIGERGINVSGGQKARISLARTLYAQADINFLDDPLSAVDANVCDHLFHKAIKGAICGTGKTAVLVTHQVHLLEHCDLIIVLDASGAVRASCPYADLAKNGVDMSELDAIVKSADDVVDDKGEDTATKSTKSTKSINQLSGKREEVEEVEQESTITRIRSASLMLNKDRSHSLQSLDKESNSIRAGSVKVNGSGKEGNNGELVEDEERSIGLVKSETYLFVLSSGAWFNVALVFIFAIGSRVIAQYTVYFMADWGQANAIAEIQGKILSFETQSNYIKTYTAYCMGGALVALMCKAASCMHGLKCMLVYHEEMLGRVMRAPISWFDVTPVGRITNRFSGDLALADFGISAMLAVITIMVVNIVANLVSIAWVTKGTFLILMFPLIFVYARLSSFFRKTKVEITRLFRVSNSPVMVEVNQTLGGMTSIRAYESVTRFQSRLEEAVEKSGAIKLLNEKCRKWIDVRVEILGSVITFFVVLLTITTSLVPVNYAGPALEFGLETTMLFGALLNTQSNLETLMASVERIHEYSEKVPMEDNDGADASSSSVNKADGDSNGPGASESDKTLLRSNNWQMKRQEPPADWPTEGKIEFADVFMRYRKGPLILKGVDFTISPKEKVGIAGRTASGKSTILVNLFRMEPIEKGRIEIDGIDIASVPVKTLRERLCIIPQDPVMFTETLRRNVDPFDQFSDAEIHDVLECVQLRDMVHALPDGLQSLITEGGENISVGQRQLICFARALLKKPKIVVLDEATAAVDNHTDNLIQTMIHERFKDCTVLTIAHRLNTIITSDRILVMEQGKVGELDTPQNLKSRPDGIFARLWSQYESSHHQK